MSTRAHLLGRLPDRAVILGIAGLAVGIAVGASVFRPEAPARAEPASLSVTAHPSGPSDLAEVPQAAPKPAAAVAPVPRIAEVESIAEDDDPSEAAPAEGEVAAAPADAAPVEPVALPPEISKGVSAERRAAIEADKWFKQLRINLHDGLGTGALASAAGLTPAGDRIVRRVRMLDDDVVSPLGYGVEALEARLREYPTDAAGVGALEAQLGRALIRLVFDYRVLKITGPFRLVGETDVAKDLALQRDTRTLATEFATAADEAAADAVLDPPHPNWLLARETLKRYRGMVAAGGCGRVTGGYRPGSKGEGVKKLQARLQCEGYYNGEIDGLFDEDVRLAVAQFQRHHELEDEGNVLGETLASLNVPVERRAEQLELAMKRLRETRVRELGPRYLKVNIPAYELVAVKDWKVVKRNKVIVGTNRLDDDKISLVQGHLNRTKLFVSKLYQVLVNPTWILPERVSKGELVGKMETDPDYLKKMGIGKRTLPDGREVLIQGQGRDNVLGKVKFLLEKTNAIYLHDTDKPWLFKEQRRAFSHGCMRVHEAVAFAKWLLLEDGYPEAEADRSLALVKMQKGMDLKSPWPFLTEYVTVDFTDEGLPKFLTDAYGYDKSYEKGFLPPRTQVRWGSKILRPRWVPHVGSGEVDEWRKEGQSAPRDPNFKPTKPIPEDDDDPKKKKRRNR